MEVFNTCDSSGVYSDLVLDFEDLSIEAQGSRNDVPTYRFPGTWDNARHESTKATKNVGTAAMKFGSAIAYSGLGTAGRSVGGFFTASASSGATIIASRAIKASAKHVDKLPETIKNWLNTDNVAKVNNWADVKTAKLSRAIEAKRRVQIRKEKLEAYAQGEITLSQLEGDLHFEDEAEFVEHADTEGPNNEEMNFSQVVDQTSSPYDNFVGMASLTTHTVCHLPLPAAVEPSKVADSAEDVLTRVSKVNFLSFSNIDDFDSGA
ncbi:hypothetical protein N0V90_000843 [Kalmusia sp. IMI 367209]|nr:hypothetical protein N0V90_000843 [Kalmusia sp. IMI 367209]